MTQANDERAARKEYIRRRQKTVFSIVGAVMVVAMVVSLLFFSMSEAWATSSRPPYSRITASRHRAPSRKPTATRPSM